MNMQVSVRSYLTAGVALAGAAVIAVSPVAPPLPDIYVPAGTSAAVHLTSAFDPYVQLVENTATSLGGLATQFLTPSPAPILQQLIANQITSVSTLTNAVLEVVPQVVSGLAAVPQVLKDTFALLAQGDISNAMNTLELGLLINLGLPFFGLFGPIQQVIAQPLQNLTNVANQFGNIVTNLGLAAVGALYTPAQAVANAIQGVIDAAKTGELGAIANAVIAMPAVILDGTLNGVQLPQALPGLLTPTEVQGGGLIGSLLSVRTIVAEAIGYVAPESAAAAPVAALKSAAADKSVVATAHTAPPTSSVEPKSGGAGTETTVTTDTDTTTVAGDAATESKTVADTGNPVKARRGAAGAATDKPGATKHNGVAGSKRAAAKAGSNSGN